MPIVNFPLTEWSPDLGDTGNHLTKVVNTLPSPKGYIPVKSFISTNTSSDDKYKIPTGSLIITVLDKTFALGTKINELIGNFELTDKTKTGVTYKNAKWDYIEFNDNLIFTNGQDTIQYLDLTNSSAKSDELVDISAKAITQYAGHVVIANLDQAHGKLYTVKWSGLQDHTKWTPSASTQSGEQNIINGGEIVALETIGNNCIILMENAIYRMTKVGGSLIMRFDEIETRGCAIRDSLVKSGSRLYFISKTGIRVTNGSGESQPIGYGKVDDWFWDNYNDEKPMQALNIPDSPLIYWSFEKLDGNRTILVFNEILNKFSELIFPHESLGLFKTPIYTLDQLTGNLNKDYATSFDVVTKHSPIIGVMLNNKIHINRGSLMESEINTAFIEQGMIRTITELDPKYSKKTSITGQVLSKLYSDGDTKTSVEVKAHPKTGKVPIKALGAYHSLILKTSGDYGTISDININIVGNSKK